MTDAPEDKKWTIYANAISSFENDHGLLMVISSEGKVSFSPRLEPEEAAKAAWESLLQMAEVHNVQVDRDANALVAAALRENCVNCCGTGKDARGYDCDCSIPPDAQAALEAVKAEAATKALQDYLDRTLAGEHVRVPMRPLANHPNVQPLITEARQEGCRRAAKEAFREGFERAAGLSPHVHEVSKMFSDEWGRSKARALAKKEPGA
ncbi:hypothetical protein [Pseudooceanicola atlanticus]|uniref:hypothetical protein n=1 Tax=Pseudooceanicola atlanticus TaxID=1461694 RepID=UPI002354FDAB|nr:hypothetical protein [Pseudooceanicola atlanticus]